MGSSSPPAPPSPQESASASLQATLAGDEYQTLNAPLQGYSDLYLQSMLDPARAQLSSAINAQTALQGAQAQQAIQSQVDPLAYATRQMNLKAATSRLGQLYGMDPRAFSYKAPGAFATPTSAQIPDISNVDALTQAIAGHMIPVSLDKSGGVNVGSAQSTASIPSSALPAKATGAIPSYLGVKA